MASYLTAAGVFTFQQFGFGPCGINPSAGGVQSVGYPHLPGLDEYARVLPPPLPLEILEQPFQNDTSNVSGGTVFNDSGAGTITLSGTGTESQTHTSSAAGTVTLSGARTESQSHTGSGTGTITLSGTRTESASATESRSGTITLTGTRTESASHSASRAGTVSLAGAMAQSQSHTATGTGTITLSGSASENFQPPGAPTVVNERMLLRVGV